MHHLVSKAPLRDEQFLPRLESGLSPVLSSPWLQFLGLPRPLHLHPSIATRATTVGLWLSETLKVLPVTSACSFSSLTLSFNLSVSSSPHFHLSLLFTSWARLSDCLDYCCGHCLSNPCCSFHSPPFFFFNVCICVGQCMEARV